MEITFISHMQPLIVRHEDAEERQIGLKSQFARLWASRLVSSPAT